MGRIEEAMRRLETIEEEFFELDKEGKTARIRLEYEKAGDIFSSDVVTKTPAMSEEFIETLSRVVSQIPDRYSFSVDVAFDDMEGWTGEELAEIAKKNIYLLAKLSLRGKRDNNRLALSMCLTGVLFLFLSTMISRALTDDSFLGTLIAFALDIMATVPFWGAMEIFFIDNRENRRNVVKVIRHFESITFRRKSDGRP